MKLAVDQIQVDESERIRADIGNLKSLEESIESVGLINPLVVDENNMLIAGYRRLQACKNLGFKEVDVAVVDFDGDPLKKFEVEVAENFFRKDFTPEEILSTEIKRREIIESRRKKGFFERLWLWFKSLFVSAPTSNDSNREEENRQETVEKGERRNKAGDEKQQAADHSPAEEEQPEIQEDKLSEPDEEQSEIQEDRLSEPEEDGSKQHRRADRDRTIQWRTS
ncbi:MAG TPA: ParB N-terminal domain-containing protein [Desulfopila sp.]|nr:ParB N-terminal domain-containing protein [Desulfopila sp.]